MVATTRPVTASILDRVSEAVLATQTDPWPDAMALGPIPTGMVFTGSLAPGLTSDTVPSRLLATQTSPSATVTPTGPRPTWMSVTWSAALIRISRPAAPSVTHVAPAP